MKKLLGISSLLILFAICPTISSAATPSSLGTTTVSDLIITSASTKIGLPIVEEGQTVGYSVTFKFTAQAPVKNVYLSKSPSTAFTLTHSGFGTIIPRINNITAAPSSVRGDTGSYFFISSSTSRTFTAFAILRSDGLRTGGSKFFQISKINYGTQPKTLKEQGTTQRSSDLKAVVQLALRRVAPPPVSVPLPSANTATPSPRPGTGEDYSPPLPYWYPKTTPSPSSNPTYSPSPTNSGAPAAPPPTGGAPLSATCTGDPSTAEVGGFVVWQAVTKGGQQPLAYTWSGTDGLSGEDEFIAQMYSSSGTKNASVRVSSQGKSVSASCSVSVVGNSSPSPGTSGGVTIRTQQEKRGIVAGVLYSVGDLLDAIFGR